MSQEESKNTPYGYFQGFVVAFQNGPLVAVIYTLYLDIKVCHYSGKKRPPCVVLCVGSFAFHIAMWSALTQNLRNPSLHPLFPRTLYCIK